MKHENTTMLSDEWLTPRYITKDLGEFDTDPCVPVNMPWTTARIMYNINNNGLLMPWDGRIWLNPPYGKDIDAWMNKMALSNNGLALVFARTETQWFHSFVWNVARGMFFFKRRIKFLDINGNESGNAGAPSILIAYGKSNNEILAEYPLQGQYVNLEPELFMFIINDISKTWKIIVGEALQMLNDPKLQDIYECVQRIAPNKVKRNKFFREKIRQTIQYHFK